jgi:hypothetical protein
LSHDGDGLVTVLAEAFAPAVGSLLNVSVPLQDSSDVPQSLLRADSAETICATVTLVDTFSQLPQPLDPYRAHLNVVYFHVRLSPSAVCHVENVLVVPSSSGWTVCGDNITTPGGNRSFFVGDVLEVDASFRVDGYFPNSSSFSISSAPKWSFRISGDHTCFHDRPLTVVSNQPILTATHPSAQVALRYPLPAPHNVTGDVTLMVNRTSACVGRISSGGSLVTVDFQTCVPPLSSTLPNQTVTSVVELLRPDGYVDVVVLSRKTIASPQVQSLQGCLSDVFPSAVECPLNGTRVLDIRGVGFLSADNFTVSWQFPTYAEPTICLQLVVMSDTWAQCVSYPGQGTDGVTQIRLLADPSIILSTSPSVRLSYTLENVILCPFGPNGLQCNGHGQCDFTTGQCTCDADGLQGYWAGVSCDGCSLRYNRSVDCKLPCPTNEEGVICSGLGFCTQGQCL